MRNSVALLTDVINDGVRLLVYAGNVGRFIISSFLYFCEVVSYNHCVDMMCNFMVSVDLSFPFMMS